MSARAGTLFDGPVLSIGAGRLGITPADASQPGSMEPFMELPRREGLLSAASWRDRGPSSRRSCANDDERVRSTWCGRGWIASPGPRTEMGRSTSDSLGTSETHHWRRAPPEKHMRASARSRLSSAPSSFGRVLASWSGVRRVRVVGSSRESGCGSSLRTARTGRAPIRAVTRGRRCCACRANRRCGRWFVPLRAGHEQIGRAHV